jgi:hypothetical protein
MKTTKQYPSKCYNCGGTGVDYKQLTGMDTSAICIVCNGSKVITVTETTEYPDPQEITMADVNRPGLQKILIDYDIFIEKMRWEDYMELTPDQIIDAFFYTLDNKQAEADEDYRKNGRAT